MAKKKKTQELSPEELLEQALVPEDEQPYPVPENWVWVYGKAIFLPMESQKPFGDFFRYIDIDAIDNENQKVTNPKILPVTDAPSRASRKVREGDTLFSLVRPYLRNIAYIDSSLSECIASTGFYVCRPNNAVNGKYIYYLMTSDYVVNGLNTHMRGDNSPSIRKNDIEDFAYPLPPLAEQKRIVDRVESLFTKLEQAKELVQSALEQFESRKAAILHKAFTGELTAKWREENGVGMESWKKFLLQEVCDINPKRIDINDVSDDTEVTFVPMQAVSEITGEIESPLIKPLREVKKGYTNFCEGDVLFAKITPCMENGKSAIVGSLKNNIGFGSTEFHVLRCTERLHNRYLYHLVRSQAFRDKAKEVMTGAVGQQRVPKNFLENYPLYLPTLSEQEQIVRILDDLLEKEQKALHFIDIIDKIELIKKSILARAFRGELGTNDPADESAKELLKKVLSNS